jgi:hypothetical protein
MQRAKLSQSSFAARDGQLLTTGRPFSFTSTFKQRRSAGITKYFFKMIIGKIITALTSQHQPIYTYCATNVANNAGGGAGASVTAAVAFPTPMSYPNGFPTTNYSVQVQPNQSCLAAVTGKTQAGFNVVLTPSPATATLAAGTFDVVVHG